MSVLTKVFVVLLVVVSLLTSAGILVFVNQTQNFKNDIVAEKNSRLAAEAQNKALMSAATASLALEASLRKQRDDLADQVAKAGSPDDAKTISDLNEKLAKANSDLAIAQISVVNLGNEIAASEATRTKLTTDLGETRKENDTLNKNNSDQSLAIADLTSKNDVLNYKTREFTEQNVELKNENSTLASEIVDITGRLGDRKVASTFLGAPKINGVVLSTSSQNGVPNATISVGTDADVKVGMRFYVVDATPNGKGFLGVLTIDSVDAKEATGRLEGPKLSDVKKDVEVKTHLE